MKPVAEDRLSDTQSRRGPSNGLLLAAVVVVVAITLFVFLRNSNKELPPEVPSAVQSIPDQVPVAELKLPPAPDIPPAVPQPEAKPLEAMPAAPAITLEDSDMLLRESLGPATESTLLAPMLAQDDLIEHGASLADSFSRGLVPRKMLPISPPTKPFSTIEVDGQSYLDPMSYQRYDSYTNAIMGLDMAQLAASFHRFRPLLEQAYGGLGYSPEEFDNALIRTLDRILGTPEIDQPIAVQRVEAIYKFVDPALEELSPLQKQMIRMGPDNTAKIKQQAAALRGELLAQ